MGLNRAERKELTDQLSVTRAKVEYAQGRSPLGRSILAPDNIHSILESLALEPTLEGVWVVQRDVRVCHGELASVPEVRARVDYDGRR